MDKLKCLLQPKRQIDYKIVDPVTNAGGPVQSIHAIAAVEEVLLSPKRFASFR